MVLWLQNFFFKLHSVWAKYHDNFGNHDIFIMEDMVQMERLVLYKNVGLLNIYFETLFCYIARNSVSGNVLPPRFVVLSVVAHWRGTDINCLPHSCAYMRQIVDSNGVSVGWTRITFADQLSLWGFGWSVPRIYGWYWAYHLNSINPKYKYEEWNSILKYLGSFI